MLGIGPLRQVQHAMGVHGLGLGHPVHRIMEEFHRRRCVELGVTLPQVMKQRRGVGGRGHQGLGVDMGRFHVDDLGDEQGVMGGHGAPRLGDEVRLGQAMGLAGFLQDMNHRIGVFRHRIVHRAGTARASALVIHAQPAAHIHIAQRRAELVQVGEVARGFGQAAADVAHIGHLGAHVKVQQLQAIAQAGRLQLLDTGQDLRGREAKLGFLPAGVLPVAAAEIRQSHSHPEQRPHAQLRRFPDDGGQFRRFLDHDHRAQSQAACDQGAADVVAILVAIADDQAAGAGQGQHGHEFGFAAGLQAHALAAVADDFLHHGALLVDLDGIHGGIAATVAMLGDGSVEGAAQGIDAIVQDVGEAHQDGQVQARLGHPLSQFRQGDLTACWVPQRQGNDLAPLIHIEIALAPFRHVVELASVVGRGVWGHGKPTGLRVR